MSTFNYCPAKLGTGDLLSSSVLGFDFGHKKIGVATGQSLTGNGSPLPALPSRQEKPDWGSIEALIKEWSPDALVVGLPLNMDDTESELSARARRFARQLNGRFHLPVWMVDERLSIREARAQLGDNAKRGPDSRVDSIAATLIIETYFTDGGLTP